MKSKRYLLDEDLDIDFVDSVESSVYYLEETSLYFSNVLPVSSPLNVSLRRSIELSVGFPVCGSSYNLIKSSLVKIR